MVKSGQKQRVKTEIQCHRLLLLWYLYIFYLFIYWFTHEEKKNVKVLTSISSSLCSVRESQKACQNKGHS